MRRRNGRHARRALLLADAFAQQGGIDRVERLAGQRLAVQRLAVGGDAHGLVDLGRTMAVERAQALARFQVDDDDRAARPRVCDVAGLAVAREATAMTLVT